MRNVDGKISWIWVEKSRRVMTVAESMQIKKGGMIKIIRDIFGRIWL